MTPSRYILRRVVKAQLFFLYLHLQSSESIPGVARDKKSIFASGTFRYSLDELVLCVFVKMAKIFLFYLLCLFAV